MMAVLGRMPWRPQDGLQRPDYIFFRIVTQLALEVAKE